MEEDEVLVSFDVKSLFTSVPVKDAINVIKEITEQDPNFEHKTEITANTLTEMLQVCLISTSFQFPGRHSELED